MNLAFIMILQYEVITYMDKDRKIDMTDPSMIILMYLYTVKDIEQINQVDHSGYYVAFTICFMGAAYFILAIVCKGILSGIYLMHTGHKGHQQISFADNLVCVAVGVYATWFFFTVYRDPKYDESIEHWGEIIDSALLLDFNANLHNFHDHPEYIVSVRFPPFLVVTAMWIYLFSRL